MNVFTDPNALPRFNKAVITIGSFDGVHLGHRKIIEKMNHISRQIGGESVLITFHPHPRQIIYPNDEPIKILSTVLEKIHLLSSTGLQNLVIVPFTVELSQMHPDEYLQNFIIKKFAPAYVVIGYDHRFGLNRMGNIDYLKWYSKQFNYQLVEIPRTEIDDMGVSSTKIRKALEIHDIKTANEFLGHPYLISGKVVGGNKIGQQIGFPTANIEIEDKNKLKLPNGIYAAYANYDGERYQGMLYIGDRPILKDDKTNVVEINLFNFNESVYGAILAVEVIAFIRPDKNISELDELRTQILEDKSNIESVFVEYENEQIKNQGHNTTKAVVILNYNGLELLQKFIPSLIQLTPNANIYVADNGSTDNSIDWMTIHHPSVNIISLPANLGYAGGYNKALEQLDEEIFVLVNSDIEVTEGWLDALLDPILEHQNVGAVQPKILDFNNKGQFEHGGAAGGYLDALGYSFTRGRIFTTIEEDTGQYDTQKEICWASGACMAVRSELFRALGGFDADYFAHFEEIDFCWRLHSAGYKVICNPKSVVYHVGGGTLAYSSTNKTYLNFRNNLYTLVKNEYFLNLLWVIPLRILSDLCFIFYQILSGKAQHALFVLLAYGRFIFAIPNLFYKRLLFGEKIEKVRLPDAPNTGGFYRGFIIWQYLALGKKEFRKL